MYINVEEMTISSSYGRTGRGARHDTDTPRWLTRLLTVHLQLDAGGGALAAGRGDGAGELAAVRATTPTLHAGSRDYSLCTCSSTLAEARWPPGAVTVQAYWPRRTGRGARHDTDTPRWLTRLLTVHLQLDAGGGALAAGRGDGAGVLAAVRATTPTLHAGSRDYSLCTCSSTLAEARWPPGAVTVQANWPRCAPRHRPLHAGSRDYSLCTCSSTLAEARWPPGAVTVQAYWPRCAPRHRHSTLAHVTTHCALAARRWRRRAGRRAVDGAGVLAAVRATTPTLHAGSRDYSLCTCSSTLAEARWPPGAVTVQAYWPRCAPRHRHSTLAHATTHCALAARRWRRRAGRRARSRCRRTGRGARHDTDTPRWLARLLTVHLQLDAGEGALAAGRGHGAGVLAAVRATTPTLHAGSRDYSLCTCSSTLAEARWPPGAVTVQAYWPRCAPRHRHSTLAHATTHCALAARRWAEARWPAGRGDGAGVLAAVRATTPTLHAGSRDYSLCTCSSTLAEARWPPGAVTVQAYWPRRTGRGARHDTDTPRWLTRLLTVHLQLDAGGGALAAGRGHGAGVLAAVRATTPTLHAGSRDYSLCTCSSTLAEGALAAGRGHGAGVLAAVRATTPTLHAGSRDYSLCTLQLDAGGGALAAGRGDGAGVLAAVRATTPTLHAGSRDYSLCTCSSTLAEARWPPGAVTVQAYWPRCAPRHRHSTLARATTHCALAARRWRRRAGRRARSRCRRTGRGARHDTDTPRWLTRLLTVHLQLGRWRRRAGRRARSRCRRTGRGARHDTDTPRWLTRLLTVHLQLDAGGGALAAGRGDGAGVLAAVRATTPTLHAGSRDYSTVHLQLDAGGGALAAGRGDGAGVLAAVRATTPTLHAGSRDYSLCTCSSTLAEARWPPGAVTVQAYWPRRTGRGARHDTDTPRWLTRLLTVHLQLDAGGGALAAGRGDGAGVLAAVRATTPTLHAGSRDYSLCTCSSTLAEARWPPGAVTVQAYWPRCAGSAGRSRSCSPEPSASPRALHDTDLPPDTPRWLTRLLPAAAMPWRHNLCASRLLSAQI
ncbi:hypothetical protein ACJJTC_015069 [Scirpophaga incertulas]